MLRLSVLSASLLVAIFVPFSRLSAEVPALGQEVIPATEAADIAKITAMIAFGVKRGYDQNGKAIRDAHPKHHGCVRAEFKVEPVEAELAKGLFATPKTYPAWIRYSNGAGTIKDDRQGDGRGMAIKVMDVPGQKILEDERDARTQDFLMINHPVFFVRNMADYVHFTQAGATGNPMAFFATRPHEGAIAKAIASKQVVNPLAIQYWSMTPVSLGDKAIKYSARPCQGQRFVTPTSGPNQLREAMREQLGDAADAPVCFEFLVQTQVDAVAMPIEDPTIEWSEQLSPFRKVATVTIARQSFESDDQMTFCENLSLTPWHSLPEHRPLGGIQRGRKTIYQEIARLRHQLNGVPRVEPTP